MLSVLEMGILLYEIYKFYRERGYQKMRQVEGVGRSKGINEVL